MALEGLASGRSRPRPHAPSLLPRTGPACRRSAVGWRRPQYPRTPMHQPTHAKRALHRPDRPPDARRHAAFASLTNLDIRAQVRRGLYGIMITSRRSTRTRAAASTGRSWGASGQILEARAALGVDVSPPRRVHGHLGDYPTSWLGGLSTAQPACCAARPPGLLCWVRSLVALAGIQAKRVVFLA